MAKKIYTIILLGLLTLLLMGCKMREKPNEIKFIKDEKIEYTKDFKVSSLIEKVDKYSREELKFTEDDSTIKLPNNKTVMVNYDKDTIQLGTISFAFKYGGALYKKKITLCDTTPPQINCLSKYDVEKGNKYFRLENLITFTDNYSSENDIERFFNGSYDIDKVGKYTVEILAYDKKKNKSSKKVVINIKDEKVNIDYNKPAKDYKPSSNGSSSQSNSQNSTKNKNNSSSKKPSSSTYIPKSRTFTIDTYDTLEECLQAWEKYVFEEQKKGFVGTAKAQPIQRDGLDIGYKAIFE